MASNKPDNSEAKIKPELQDNETVDSQLRVAIVNEKKFLGQVSAEMAASIKSQLTAGLREAVRDKVFVPTFKKWTHTEEILRATCTDTRALAWLTKAVERIPETSDRKFKVIPEDQLPKVLELTKISLFIPGAKVEEMDDIEKMLVLQNSNIKVNSWCLFRKVQKDDGLLIVAGTVDEDVAAIKAQGGSIFYELSTVKVKIYSTMDSESIVETDHTSKEATNRPESTKTEGADLNGTSLFAKIKMVWSSFWMPPKRDDFVSTMPIIGT